MNTKTTQPFSDTICADVRKIIDAIFKDCRQEDIDRLHLTSCNYVSDCEKFKFHDYWNYSGQTKGCELKFNVGERTDYEIILTGIQCEDGTVNVSYGIDISGDFRHRGIAVNDCIRLLNAENILQTESETHTILLSFLVENNSLSRHCLKRRSRLSKTWIAL